MKVRKESEQKAQHARRTEKTSDQTVQEYERSIEGELRIEDTVEIDAGKQAIDF